MKDAVRKNLQNKYSDPEFQDFLKTMWTNYIFLRIKKEVNLKKQSWLTLLELELNVKG